jgi:hypothetical protein
MPHKSRKVLIILIPIILIAVIAIALTMLYIRTDFLKSDNTLFLKYILQNVDVAKTIIDNTDPYFLTKIFSTVWTTPTSSAPEFSEGNQSNPL